MKKRNLKIGLIVLLVLLMFGLTYTSFAAWDNLTKTDDVDVIIGEGKTIVVDATATAPAGKALIPVNAVDGPDEVTSITLKYNVNIDNPTAQALNLSVTESNVKINGLTTNAGLVDIDITAPAKLSTDTTTVEVIVVVTLVEQNYITDNYPEAVYKAIIGKPITFTLTFTASK